MGAVYPPAEDSECIPRLAGSTPAVQKLAKLLGDAPSNDPMLQLVAAPRRHIRKAGALMEIQPILLR